MTRKCQYRSTSKSQRDDYPNFHLAHRWLGPSYVEKKMLKEAISEFRKAALWEGNPVTLALLGDAYAVSGKRKDAVRLVDHLTQLSKEEYVSPYCVAIIYVGLGEREQAFAWLDRAYADRSPFLPELNVEPRFDALRSDTRFQDKGRQMNKANRPVSLDGKKLQRMFRSLSIDHRILNRYGIEHYFTQQALETVLGANLPGHFPLSETQPVDFLMPGFRKALNGRIAKEMDLHDLAGSDLGEVM